VLHRQLINDMTWYPYLHLLFSFISTRRVQKDTELQSNGSCVDQFL